MALVFFLYFGKMSETPPRDSCTLGRSLALYQRIVEDGARTPFARLSHELGLSTSTAHRLAAELLRQGMIARVGRGRYDIGLTAVKLAAGRTFNSQLARTARPLVQHLSHRTGLTGHLGVLEDGMVTYLVKSPGAAVDSARFTQEGMQLEAYCSAVGKVLLAGLDPTQLDEYLSEGDFVSATTRTVTEVDGLRRELAKVRARGMAIDDREIADDMMCVAVPVCDEWGDVLAALSVSMTWSEKSEARIPDLTGHLLRQSSRLSRNLGMRPRQS